MRRKRSLQSHNLELDGTNLQDSPSEAGSSRRSSRSSTRMKSQLVGSVSGQKRKASPETSEVANEEIPVQRRALSLGRKVDCYCWICHQFGEDDVCSSCPRVYHSQCRKRPFNSEGLCPECQILSVDGTELKSPISPSTLKGLLLHALDTIPLNESILKKWPIDHPENEKLRCKMDRSKLIDNLNTEQFYYTKTAEFFSDIKWIFHNCTIIYGDKNPITASAKSFMNKMKEELRNMEACPECYENSFSGDKNFFAQVCNAKHPLVWAKVRGFRYWPAKCLKVINGSADVRFFKTHDKSNIQVNKCYFLSKTSPDTSKKLEDLFKEAMEELKEYLKNWELKFGTFNYAQSRKVFVPELSSDDANNTKGTKSSPNKKSRRGRHSSGKIRQAEETDNSYQMRDSAEELEEQSNISEMEISNQINESASDIEEVEIIGEVSKSRPQALVHNLNFIQGAHLDHTQPKKAICIGNSGNEVETLSVCMTFSTDEDEPSNSNEQGNDTNTSSDHPLLSVSSPQRVDRVSQMPDSFHVHNSTSGESDIEILSSISEATPIANVIREIAETVAMNGPSNLCKLVVDDINSLLSQRSVDGNSEAKDPNEHSELEVDTITIPSTSAESPSSTTSPIRIVDSGSVPIPESEIIDVENSSCNESNIGGDSSDDVQLCEISDSGQIPDRIPNFYFRRSTPFSTGSTNAHENELTTICNEVEIFMRTLISRVWAVGHKHKSANEINNLLKSMDHNVKIREEAMAKMCTEKDKECEARLLNYKITCRDLQKKLNESDLILLNTKQELASSISKLELSQKEWEAEKEKEVHALKEKLLEEMNETRKLSQDWISKKEYEEEISKTIQIKEKEFQDELANRIQIKEKEFQDELANRIKIKEKEFQDEFNSRIQIAKNEIQNELIKTMQVREEEIKKLLESKEGEVKKKIQLIEKENKKTIEEFKNTLVIKIDEFKRHEWCAKCLKQAEFRCCWNTSYCGQSCQRAHWQEHVRVCETVKDKLTAKAVTPVKEPKGITAIKEAKGITASKEKNEILVVAQPPNPNSHGPAAQGSSRELPQFLIRLESPTTNGNVTPVPSVSPSNAKVPTPRQAPRTVVRAPIFHPSSSDSPNS